MAAFSFGSTSIASSIVHILPWPFSGTIAAIRCASLGAKPIARPTSLITLRAFRF